MVKILKSATWSKNIKKHAKTHNKASAANDFIYCLYMLSIGMKRNFLISCNENGWSRAT